MRTIVIGCDNAAVHLKNELMDFMEKRGYTVENMGCDSTEDSTYYPYVAEKVCQEIINSGYQMGSDLDGMDKPHGTVHYL